MGGYYVHVIAKRMPNVYNRLPMPYKVAISHYSNIFLLLKKILRFGKRRIFIWLRLIAPFLVQNKLCGLIKLQYKFGALAKFAFNLYGTA